jgi:hypothetical protein
MTIDPSFEPRGRRQIQIGPPFWKVNFIASKMLCTGFCSFIIFFSEKFQKTERSFK